MAATLSPIRMALAQWPPERFPRADYVGYWEYEFSGYAEQSVADAINAVKMDSDPYSPTVAAVRSKLNEWGLVSTVARERENAAMAAERLRISAECKLLAEKDKADNELCYRLSDEQFAQAANAVLPSLDPDVVALLKRKPLKSWQLVRRMVAEYARVHRMVPSRVMEVA